MRRHPFVARLTSGPSRTRGGLRLVRAALALAVTAALSPAGAQGTSTAPPPTAPAPAASAPAPTPAAPIPGPPTIRMNLEESLRATLARSPEAKQAIAELEGYRGKQLQALGIGRPQVELQTVLGPSPRARGNQVSSPDDQYSPDITGVFVRGTVSIIQPIFTWGLIENARLAAEHGVRAAQAGVDAKNSEVALRVKQA